MKKGLILTLTGCLFCSTVFLSGCQPQAPQQVVIPDVIQVQEADAAEGKITLTSSETVEVVPDMAEIMFGISTEHSSAEKCQQENAEKLDNFLEYLKEQGFEEKSIKTSGFNLNPRYDWSGNSRQLIGYEMQTTVTVTDVPMEQAGSMLSQGLANGANEIYNVSYFASSYDEAYEQALTKAVELAKGKAEALAAASGKELGSVLSIEEYRDNQSGRYVTAGVSMSKNLSAGMVAETAAAADMAVEPGELQVTADISIVFEMQ